MNHGKEETSNDQQITIEEEVLAPTTTAAPKPTFFSVAPKNDLFFQRQFSETFNSREHIYRIEIVDEDMAFYYLVDDEATRKHAFNIPDSYILPAMEVDGNGRLADAKKITTTRGQLKKAGNNWQIEEKAVLQYEL